MGAIIPDAKQRKLMDDLVKAIRYDKTIKYGGDEAQASAAHVQHLERQLNPLHRAAARKEANQ